MPDGATIRELVSGGVGVISLAVLCWFMWLQFKERSESRNSLESLTKAVQGTVNSNTQALTKLESAVEKLERRLDEHDRILYQSSKS